MSAPDTKNERPLTILSGPPKLARTRLNPVLMFFPNGSSVSQLTLPLKAVLEPVRVAMLMMPDWALPNSAELAPVVTEASSKPPTPMMISLPPDTPPGLERLPGVTGTPSM